jgi:hypothetical protein
MRLRWDALDLNRCEQPGADVRAKPSNPTLEDKENHMDSMNRVTGKIMSRTALALSLFVLSFPRSANSQSDKVQGNCQEASGILDEVFIPEKNGAAGIIRNGGWLNGTTFVTFTGAASFPLPGIAVFTGQGTFSTNHGLLKTSNIYLLDVSKQNGSVLAHVDPDASTGKFAGASGTLFLNTIRANVTANPQTFRSEVHGQVCLAKR